MTTTVPLTLIAADPRAVLAGLGDHFADVVVVDSAQALGEGVLLVSGDTDTDLTTAALAHTWDAVYLDAARPPSPAVLDTLGDRGVSGAEWLGRLPVVRLTARSEAVAPVHGSPLAALAALAPLLADGVRIRDELDQARDDLEAERQARVQERRLVEPDGDPGAWRDRLRRAQRKQKRAEQELARLRSSRAVRLQRAASQLLRRVPGGARVAVGAAVLLVVLAAVAPALLGVPGTLGVLTALLVVLALAAVSSCAVVLAVVQESAHDLDRLDRAVDRSRRSNDRAHRRAATAASDMTRATSEARERLQWIEAELIALRAAASPPSSFTTAGTVDGPARP